MTRCYCLLPDGTCFVQEAMSGAPSLFHTPVQHPGLASLQPINPAATHVRFVQTPLYATQSPSERDDLRDSEDVHGHMFVGLRLYVLSAAVTQVGPQILDDWDVVPLHAEEESRV